MYEAKLGTETTTDITQIDAPRPKLKPKTPRPPEPRMEERIVIKKKRKEYLNVDDVQNIERLNREISDVHEIMKENINLIIEIGRAHV